MGSEKFLTHTSHDLHLADTVSNTFIFQKMMSMMPSSLSIALLTMNYVKSSSGWQSSKGSYPTKAQAHQQPSTPTKMSKANSSRKLQRCYWIVFML
jgi:hypothetical protein